MEFNENNETDPRIKSRSVGFGTPAVLTREQSKALEDTVTTFVADSDCVARMSGPTVYNAFLRGVTYNWTLDAMQDFDLIVPYLKQTLPFGQSILDNETGTNLRSQLQKLFNNQFENIPGGPEFQDVQLFPPGKVSVMLKVSLISELFYRGVSSTIFFIYDHSLLLLYLHVVCSSVSI